MERDGYQREIVEHTGPLWRLLAVTLVFLGVFFLGWLARNHDLVDQFATFSVVTLYSAALFWANRRPDKLRRRVGPYGKIALAIQESAGDIRASVYARTFYYALAYGALNALVVIAAKAVVVAVATSIYAWQIVAAAGCLTAAVVIAPQFFAAAVQRMSVPDDDPEEMRGVESGEPIERGESMSEPRNREEVRSEENGESRKYRKNAEAKFASPEDDIGVGYYFDGEEVSPTEFGRLVDERAERLRERGDE